MKNSIILGGFLTNSPDLVRTRLFSRQIHFNINCYLERLSIGSQQANGPVQIELYCNSTTIHNETITAGLGTEFWVLPFLKFFGQGLIECFITPNLGVPSTITVSYEGFHYV